MTIADLRRLAEQLPAGASLTLDRATLLEVLPAAEASTTYTVATLATQLHRSASTVRGWLQAGLFPGAYQLPGTKRPGAWRIPQAAVDAFSNPGARVQEAPGATIGPRKASRPRQTKGGNGNLGAWRAARPAVSSPRTPT